MNKQEYFTIETRYKLPTWENVTLAKYMQFLKLQKDCPDFFKEKMEVPLNRYESEGLPYIAKFIQFWTDCPSSELWQAEKEEVEKLYHLISKRLEIDSKLFPFHKMVEFGGKKFFLGEKLMKRRTLGEYAQTAQLEQLSQEQAGRTEFALPKILCILLQEEEQKYDPESTDLYKNESLFLSMPMNLVWMVVFFCKKRSSILERITRFYTSRQQAHNVPQG